VKHIVCYSGGHSSALVAIEVVRRYGKDDVILLNHDIHPSVEEGDIKRFKQAVADYLGLPITYANHPQWDTMDQFDVVRAAGAFKVGTGTALCSSRLKTEPFHKWLDQNYPAEKDVVRDDVRIYYGFDANERQRIQRRSQVLAVMGYHSDYPLALWKDRTIQSTKEVGIEPPLTYGVFKHANCTGCLKAGMQHWYAVYCTRPDIWEKAKATEEAIGYSIIKGTYLDELEARFSTMQARGVKPTEHIHANTFWADVRKLLGSEAPDAAGDAKPCECVF
jgi:hypothetical protein